jgi:hypothetical protein
MPTSAKIELRRARPPRLGIGEDVKWADIPYRVFCSLRRHSSVGRDRKFIASNNRRLVMTTPHANASFAVKAGYYLLAAAILIFVSMLFLTLHQP